MKLFINLKNESDLVNIIIIPSSVENIGLSFRDQMYFSVKYLKKGALNSKKGFLNTREYYTTFLSYIDFEENFVEINLETLEQLYFSEDIKRKFNKLFSLINSRKFMLSSVFTSNDLQYLIKLLNKIKNKMFDRNSKHYTDSLFEYFKYKQELNLYLSENKKYFINIYGSNYSLPYFRDIRINQLNYRACNYYELLFSNIQNSFSQDKLIENLKTKRNKNLEKYSKRSLELIKVPLTQKEFNFIFYYDKILEILKKVGLITDENIS